MTAPTDGSKGVTPIARLQRLLFLALLVVGAASPGRTAERVDLLLVLASDVSRSVDFAKFRLQREGYAKAVRDPRVLNAVTSGTQGRIAVLFLEWAGAGQQKVVVDWTVIDGPESAAAFGDQMLTLPRSFADRTSISGAIDVSMQQIARAPFEASRRTIDVSGDGTNNSGREVTEARDEALAQGVSINGLVILTSRPQPWNSAHTNPPGGLESYYRDNVIGGPGSFVLTAEDHDAFGQAIVKKLIAEIAQLSEP